MKSLRTNKALNKFTVLIFALSVIFPTQVVLALKDCGPHEVVSCEKHDNQHFVARHVENVKVAENIETGLLIDSRTSSSEDHDSAHQIEKSKQRLTPIIEISNGFEKTIPFVIQLVTQNIENSFIKNVFSLKAHSDPDNWLLFHLPSVRIQV